MTTASTLESRETVSLIGSDKVEGTAVYGADDKKFGKLERVMIDKISGKVSHAVLSFGGFMGMGEDYYPVPWSMLKYDTNLGGYRVKLTKDQLDKAPKYSKSTDGNWNRDNDRRVYEYYKVPPYWGGKTGPSLNTDSDRLAMVGVEPSGRSATMLPEIAPNIEPASCPAESIT